MEYGRKAGAVGDSRYFAVACCNATFPNIYFDGSAASIGTLDAR
jgi:hypothetical protein